MLQDDVQLISVDDHIIEHPQVWRDRMPAALKERCPQVIETEAGMEWTFDGHRSSTIGLNAVAGKPWEERNIDPARYEDMRRGCYDVHARVADMDIDGVQAQLCFPDFPGFAGRRFIKAPDKALALECVRAWNDYVLDEWCGSAPDRFIPLVIAPLWDVDASVAEVERTIAKGARALSFPERPDGLGLPSLFTTAWEPLLDLVASAGVPLCMHFGTGGALELGPDRPLGVRWAVGAQRSMTAATEMLFGPMFIRHPQLKVALSEGGIGWIPYILERADYVWERHRFYEKVNDVKPSELFADHIYGCFIADEAGLRDRYAIGIEQIMWEGDYPHADSNFPHSRKTVTEELADIPDHEAAMIAELNARRLFHFERAS
jgi:predicted TIM-barrel fold metal-dependent hydrolase